MSAGGAVLLIVGILAFVASLLALVMVWLRARLRRMRTRLDAELAGEPALRGPEGAIYRSGSGSHPRLKGNGLIVLTERRLLFRMALGSDLDLPVADITAIREATWFEGARLGDRQHLIVRTGAGEAAFFVDDNAAWAAAIASAADRLRRRGSGSSRGARRSRGDGRSGR